MGKAIEIQAPNSIPLTHDLKVFLGGSIEMGKAINWQKTLIEALADKPILFLNPRRDDWDSSLIQNINDEQFRTQVEWELDSMERADIIVMVFDPNTMSPISLLELGLHSKSGKLVVMCPEGFWRKGNVDIVCNTYDIPMVESIEELIQFILEDLC